jgi:hypothetical protein
MTKQHVMLLAAVVAFAPPPFVLAADKPADPVVLRHRYVPGEHFVYSSNVSISAPQLRSSERSRFIFDVDTRDATRGILTIARDGRTTSRIPITIRQGGSWARGDGHAVVALTGYDANSMCRHDEPVRVGDTWNCRIDGAFQYLGSVSADPGEVQVSVARITPPTALELQIRYRGQPHDVEVMDEDTHQEVHLVKQTIRATDIVIDNGVVTSIVDHTKLATRLPNNAMAYVDVTSRKNLEEHSPR